ncbi:MAG TPA: glycosyltransferase family 4 protein [Stellaceae bacterium]|nr:glycosyltransferase family 4 protein [Stellaceae bacterium]
MADRAAPPRRAPRAGRGTDRLRILVAAHGHPEMSKGGAEIAAYQLFQELQARGDSDVWFMGCDRTMEADRTGAVLMQPFSAREYIYAPGDFDWFKFANRDYKFPSDFSQLLTELNPDVIHFHHYMNYGVEVFYNVRTTLPRCKILLTLHEFLAICHHYGQMITKAHRNLCYEASAIRCQRCFPEFSRSDFYLRKRYIQRFFDLVDGFTAPSRFLAERYIAWGLPAEKMHVIENVIPAVQAATPVRPIARSGPLRIGFFGQISLLKGINVLFDAAETLADDAIGEAVFEIFGDYRNQPLEFQNDFLERLPKAGRNVRFHGPYDSSRVDDLMQSVDVVLMTSIWWENSPVVIQEAFRNRRPVICPDIGGMAEKVRHGVDGFHFPVGSAIALAALVRQLAADRGILEKLAETMAAPPTAAEIVEAHMRLYREPAATGSGTNTLLGAE